MTVLSRIRLFGLMFGLMALVACDTAEERAEGHYQRGLQLLEEGKTEQALLEFKNALQLNEDSVAPRMEFAKIRMEQGEFRGAIGNFLKVIEVEENNLEARIHTGRLILQFENEPEEAREHIEAAAAIAPDNIEVRALLAAMDQNQGRAEDAANKALAVLADDPGNVMAVSVLVAQRIDEDDYDGVIEVVDKAIAATEAASIRDMGKVMGALKAKYTGQIDFAKVGPLVKERLG